MKFERITVNPKQMNGVPCIRGLRIPVATVVGMIAEGMTAGEILKAHPDLRPLPNFTAEGKLPQLTVITTTGWARRDGPVC